MKDMVFYADLVISTVSHRAVFDNPTRVSDYTPVDVPSCDWQAKGMSYTDDERQRIADAVRQRRIARGLDKEPAARIAKVSSITWKRVEDSEGVRDGSLGKILASLELPAADKILEGQGEDLPHVRADFSASGMFGVSVSLREVDTDALLDEVRRRIKGESNVVDQTKTPGAPSQGRQAQEVSGPAAGQDSEDWPPGWPPGREYPGVGGDQEGEEGDEFGRGQV